MSDNDMREYILNKINNLIDEKELRKLYYFFIGWFSNK